MCLSPRAIRVFIRRPDARCLPPIVRRVTISQVSGEVWGGLAPPEPPVRLGRSRGCPARTGLCGVQLPELPSGPPRRWRVRCSRVQWEGHRGLGSRDRAGLQNTRLPFSPLFLHFFPSLKFGSLPGRRLRLGFSSDPGTPPPDVEPAPTAWALNLGGHCPSRGAAGSGGDG